jgi:hypothetical protein
MGDPTVNRIYSVISRIRKVVQHPSKEGFVNPHTMYKLCRRVGSFTAVHTSSCIHWMHDLASGLP